MISDNVQARQLANELIEDLGFPLIKESGLPAEQVRRFWQYVMEGAGAIVNDPPQEVADDGLQPMTDGECKRFEDKIMPWGKHRGEKIQDVPLDYLAFIADKPDEFKDDCKRYLANERISNEYERD